MIPKRVSRLASMIDKIDSLCKRRSLLRAPRFIRINRSHCKPGRTALPVGRPPGHGGEPGSSGARPPPPAARTPRRCAAPAVRGRDGAGLPGRAGPGRAGPGRDGPGQSPFPRYRRPGAAPTSKAPCQWPAGAGTRMRRPGSGLGPTSGERRGGFTPPAAARRGRGDSSSRSSGCSSAHRLGPGPPWRGVTGRGRLRRGP